jgi:hypothetical protein
MIFRAFLLALVALMLGVPGACAHAADAPQLKSVQVSPSGGVLLARFGSNVASVKAGATVAINGGEPIALSDPAYDASSNSDWVWWPLGPRRVEVALDDDDATPAGTWGVRDSSNTAFDPGYYQFANSRFRQSVDPAATATYKHTMPAPGRYRLSAGIVWLYGPDRTTAQTYTVSDGQGEVGKFVVDMTKPPSWDRVDNLVRLHDLGRVTLRDTTLSIAVSNGATAGVLATDALYLELDLPPPVAPGDKVTFTAPAGTVTTTAGDVGETTSAPVAHTTDDVWFPYDSTRKPAMAVGYNKTFDEYDFGSRTYANRWMATTGWKPITGTIATDDRGNLTAITGTAGTLLWSPFGGSDEVAAWPNAPLSGTAVIRFHNPLGAADPGCVLSLTQSPGYTFGRAWTGVPDADGKYTLKIPFTHPDFVPLGQATVPYYDQNTYEVALKTTNIITDVEFYIEEETPAGYPSMTHPAAIERFKDRGFGCLRFLDSMAGNSPNTVEYEDWPPSGVPGFWWHNSAEVAGGHRNLVDVGLASIAPVDSGDMARWCRKANGVGWVKATTAAPHGLKTGQRPVCRGPKWPDTSDLAFDSNIPDGSKVDLGHFQCVVTGPTTLLIQVSCPSGDQTRIAGTATLGASHTLAGYRLQMSYDPVVPYADLMTFARECGFGPWVVVPHLMSDAGIAAMADATLAGIPAGTKVRVEYSNEPWNIADAFQQQSYFDAHQYRLAYLNSAGTPEPERSDPTGATRVVPRDWMECYCHLAANAHRIFRERFVAAGRPAEDVVRVMGSQAAWPGFPTQSIANYAFEHRITFDELAIENYCGSAPANTGSYATATTAAFDRLDADGLIDVLGIGELLGGREKKYRAHRAVLDGADSVAGTPFAGYFAGVKLVSYEGGITVVTGDTSEGGRRLLQLAHRTYRHPRMYRYELARLQNLDVNCGCTLSVRYNADKTDSVGGIVTWCEWPLYNGPVGTGAPGENRNPWDVWSHRAQTAGAMRTWAAAALAGGPPPPPPPPVTPVAPDTIGDRIAEAEAAADELRRALADADAATKAWAESEAALRAKVDAARDRVARASAGLTAGLAKVGPAYRKDKEGEGMSVYLPDGDGKGKVKTIRPVAPTTAVPAQSK